MPSDGILNPWYPWVYGGHKKPTELDLMGSGSNE